MTDIIERAARAIAAIDYRKGVRDCARPADPPVFTPVPWDELPAKAQLESMEKALAVLHAIREPKDDLLIRARSMFATSIEDGVSPLGRDVIKRWTRDVNAALGEE